MILRLPAKAFAIFAVLVMLASPFMISAFTTQSAAGAANACVAPQATAWVLDSGNNRILEFVAPFFSGMSASVVIGQPDFVSAGNAEGRHGGGVTAATLSSPSAMAMDSYGNLWVVDSGNNRILEFNPPFHTGMAASLVFGQTSFTVGADNGNGEHQYYWNNGGHNGWSVSQYSLYFPSAIAIDPNGNVWVSDQGNNRVVKFAPASFVNGVPQYASGEAASVVLGAKDFVGDTDGHWQDMQSQPAALAFDSSGNLWVSDSANSRILEYKAPFTTGMAASVAIGQPTLTSITSASQGDYGWGWWNNHGQNVVNSSRLNGPAGIAFDADGNLWVADAGNSRILEFTAPFTTNMVASQVLGQSSSFTNGNSNHGWGSDDADSFFTPGLLAFDGNGNLWVTDSQNNRVVVFQPPLWGGSVATMVLGQPASFQTSNSGVGQNVFNDPNGILVTSPGTTSFKLSWVKQIDPISSSTIFVTAPPADSVLNHAFLAVSAASAMYVVRVSDGTVLYHSQAFNQAGTQYGQLPSQQFTLSGVGTPIAEFGNSFNIAWVTTQGRAPTTFWLFISSVPVNQNSLPSTTAQGISNTQALSLNNLRDPATRTLVSLNPVSVAFTADGTFLIVGGTNGYVAGFARSCPH